MICGKLQASGITRACIWFLWIDISAAPLVCFAQAVGGSGTLLWIPRNFMKRLDSFVLHDYLRCLLHGILWACSSLSFQVLHSKNNNFYFCIRRALAVMNRKTVNLTISSCRKWNFLAWTREIFRCSWPTALVFVFIEYALNSCFVE